MQKNAVFYSVLGAFVALWSIIPSSAQHKMRNDEEPDEVGLVVVSDTYFPKPKGLIDISVSNGNVEAVEGKNKPKSWAGNMTFVQAEDAPEGKAYAHFKGGNGIAILLPGIDVKDYKPHLISMWMKSSGSVSGVLHLKEADTYYGRSVNIAFPDTKGKWKRVGCYLRNLPGGKNASIILRAGKNTPLPEFSVDDLRVRTATEAELTMAWNKWRAARPKRDLSQREKDGDLIPLAMDKLYNPRVPAKPFLIYAIGSSYTNMLGNGETLIQHVKSRSPEAPVMVYKKHVGSSVPWTYVRGWVQTIITPAQPDLVIVYTIRDNDALDKLLADIRRNTTADIVVPSIHWRMRDIPNWEAGKEDAADQVVEEVRKVCKKHAVEFVESRKEWAEYLKKHNLKIAIDPKNNLLKDNVHQSDYGALVINENIARHLYAPKAPAYNIQERERRLLPTSNKTIRAGETVETVGDWKVENNAWTTNTKGATLKVTFTGRRIDLIGLKQAAGGSVAVKIDGVPADKAPYFFNGYIRPGKKNNKPKRGNTADRCPHGVYLGKNVVPQSWVIKMTSDTGDYEVIGSVTGSDGKGQNEKDFTSTSGQLIIPTALWRNIKSKKSGGQYTNKTGDVFEFDVWRATQGKVAFDGQGPFYSKVIQHAENKTHVLEITANGDGPISVLGFDIFEPPYK